MTIPDTSASANWISMQEGHTLRRSRQVNYGTCMVASVTRTGSGSLLTGDFHLGAVPQDNLCDITDFSILATLWNEVIDANLSTGGDADGDGFQDTSDFTAIQVNFFKVGEDVDGCVGGTSSDGGVVPVDGDASPVDVRDAAPLASVTVDSLASPSIAGLPPR